MKFEIVELSELSGSKATIYSIFVDDDNKTLFENFMIENLREFPDEINSKVETLNQISTNLEQ
jgi:L-rhamnose mutarotase